MLDEQPYRASTPRKRTRERIARLAAVVDEHGESLTVQAPTYKLYPDAHGQDLTNAYNKTVKDAVRARGVGGLVPWGSIKEARVESSGQSLGHTDPESYLEGCLDAGSLAATMSIDRPLTSRQSKYGSRRRRSSTTSRTCTARSTNRNL
jgi:hypothetical protein